MLPVAALSIGPRYVGYLAVGVILISFSAPGSVFLLDLHEDGKLALSITRSPTSGLPLPRSDP